MGMNEKLNTKENLAITEGLFLTENNPVDLDILYTKGIIRNGLNYYFTPADGNITLTPASVGFEKLSIVQKIKNSKVAPTIKDGPEVAVATTNIAVTSSSPTVRPLFVDGSPDIYRYHGWRYANASGVDLKINYSETNSESNPGTIDISLYAVPDDGFNNPDWANKVLIETKVGVGAGTLTHTWADFSIDLDDASNVWLVFVGSNASDTDTDWNLYCAPSGTTTLSANIITISKYSDDSGVTWGAGLPNNGSWKQVKSGGVTLFRPLPDTDNASLADIGDLTTPVDENSDEVVESSPTGTQVQLLPIHKYRL